MRTNPAREGDDMETTEAAARHANPQLTHVSCGTSCPYTIRCTAPRARGMRSFHRWVVRCQCRCARLIPQVDEALSVWRRSHTVESRQPLVDVLDRPIPALKEHLSAEEDRIVPLMEQHITAAAWNEFLKEESAAVDPQHLPLMLGMLIYEGDPESVEQLIANMSAETGSVIRRLAAPAFAAHSQRVHGTATPPRSTEL